MASPASIKKHPVHPMLVGLPIGLWVFALVCDVMRAASGNNVWQTVAIYCIAAGIVGALVAAVPGLIDYFSIDEAAMKRIANLHLAVNLGAVVIFAINLWLRFRLPAESYLPLGMSIVGVLAIGVGGWLGGEMVYVKGMAVEAVEELAKKVEKSIGPPGCLTLLAGKYELMSRSALDPLKASTGRPCSMVYLHDPMAVI